MSKIIRRVLIVAALAVLIILIVQKYDGAQTSGVQLSEEELKRLLVETVNNKWAALEKEDWYYWFEPR